MRTYLVGGAVRDELLGEPVGDRDYVVVGATPEELLQRGFRPVGRDFPVFLHPQTGAEYALARTERKTGRGYHGFAVHADPSVTLEQDLARRDLTINAIARDDDGAVVDPFGGRADLQARVLRHVTPAFAEDPVRVLRVARFAARFAPLGFTIAAETMALMRTMAADGELDHLVAERVWQELERALAQPRPSAFVAALRSCGALARVLPEVDALYGVPQVAEHHPEVDCGVHIELVLDMAAQLAPGDSRVGFAALTHDLGKALTPCAQLPAHIGHERAGLEPLQSLCERLKVPAEHRELAAVVCLEHLNVHRLDQLRPATVHDLIVRCDGFRRPGRMALIAAACEADSRGRSGRTQSHYPQGAALLRAHAAAAAVRAREVLAEHPGIEGQAVGQHLREARIAAIRAALALTEPPTPGAGAGTDAPGQ
ncbi:MAG TPA: multifunctional CCA addition/repair protein [Xanthomonadaceae bacterium]|nr:multifunctional CCA addition/repair protein [Xanthomonadaceae bacterium]